MKEEGKVGGSLCYLYMCVGLLTVTVSEGDQEH